MKCQQNLVYAHGHCLSMRMGGRQSYRMSGLANWASMATRNVKGVGKVVPPRPRYAVAGDGASAIGHVKAWWEKLLPRRRNRRVGPGPVAPGAVCVAVPYAPLGLVRGRPREPIPIDGQVDMPCKRRARWSNVRGRPESRGRSGLRMDRQLDGIAEEMVGRAPPILPATQM